MQSEINKEIFSITSTQNPLMINIDNSLLNSLMGDGNNQQDELFIEIMDFAATIPTLTGFETVDNQIVWTTEQFNFRNEATPILSGQLLNTNYEISIVVEDAIGFYNNDKIQTQVIAQIFPDYVSENIYKLNGYNDNLPHDFMSFRFDKTQEVVASLQKKNILKMKFVIRNCLSPEEDNVSSYKEIIFKNAYTVVFSLH